VPHQNESDVRSSQIRTESAIRSRSNKEEKRRSPYMRQSEGKKVNPCWVWNCIFQTEKKKKRRAVTPAAIGLTKGGRRKQNGKPRTTGEEDSSPRPSRVEGPKKIAKHAVTETLKKRNKMRKVLSRRDYRRDWDSRRERLRALPPRE